LSISVVAGGGGRTHAHQQTGVALDSVPSLAAMSLSMITPAPEKLLLDIAEVREVPPPPEPLAADRLRAVVWVVPALVAALLALWWGPAAEVIPGHDAPAAGLYALWVETASGWGWFARLPLAMGAAASAALVAALGTEFSGRRTGALAGLLYAVLPGSTAVTLGPYVLDVALSLAATLLAVRLAQRPTVLRATHYALALVALGLVAPFALVVALPHGLVAAIWCRPRGRRIMLWGVSIAGALTAVVAIGGLLGVVAGLPRLAAPAGITVLTLSDWARITFGSPVAAGVVLGASALGMTLRGRAGAATGYAVVTTFALLAMAASVAPQAADSLPIIVPTWCLLAGIALGRVRMVPAGCAVALIAVLGLPGQVLLRHSDPAEPQFSGLVLPDSAVTR
jgi:mannosyltransferase